MVGVFPEAVGVIACSALLIVFSILGLLGAP
jgi:hypothetical protein